MRKYKTLVLVITSVVSLSLLIVYRNEYNRLHYVLEAFDFFGQPCNFSELLESDLITKGKDWGPYPTWQQNDDIFTYSAFLSDNYQIKAIILQLNNKEVNRFCYVWYENEEEPVLGKFKLYFLEKNEAFKQWVYLYYCSYPSSNLIPFAVSFVKRNKNPKIAKKILVGMNTKHKTPSNITMCVSPTPFSKKKFIEFVSYHQLVGVDNFIFYLHDVPHNLSKLVLLMSSKLGINTAFYNWNYPYTDTNLSRVIVEQDCLLRTKDKTLHTITLEIDEYIVPLYSKTLITMLSAYNMSKINVKLPIPVQKFCIQSNNLNRPIAVQNIQAEYDNTTNVQYMYRNSDTYLYSKIFQSNEDAVSIHKYVNCVHKMKKFYEDNKMLKFSKDLVRSTFVQMLINGKI